MICFIYLFIVLFILFMVGTVVLKIVGRICKTEWSAHSLIAPVIGLTSMMCLSQILNILFSAEIIAKVWWLLILLFLLWQGKEVLLTAVGQIKKHWFFTGVSIVGFVVLAFRMIESNELISLQYANNDIIYYLSTMDWLKEHSLLEAVQYTETQPYFVCAEYILSTTRFAADVFGSVMMTMLGIEAHQVFSFMGIMYTFLAGWGVYYFAVVVLKVSKKYSAGISFVILISFSWKELLIMQYIPQMLGILCLLMFIFMLIEYFVRGNKNAKILTSLFLVATASAYSEFASYMLIIYVGVVVIQMFTTKQWRRTFIDAVQMGITAILMNPLGFYIAVKFNLKTLENVSVSKDSIDAFGGRIKSLFNVIATIAGGPATDGYSGNIWLLRSYKLILGCGVICFLVLLFYLLIRKRNRILLFFSWILIFFVGYELYFHKIRLAYGEYKHLYSIAAILAMMMLYLAYEVERTRKYKICFIVIFVGMLLLNGKSYSSVYPDELIITYDGELMETKDGFSMIPAGEKVGLLGNYHHVQHQLVYAAKNIEVQLMGEGINSYYSMLGVPLNNTLPNYIFCMKESEELETVTNSSYETIWQNNRFMIVKCS